jgi:endoglucanase
MNIATHGLLVVSIAVGVLSVSGIARAEVSLTGVNLAGAEFGEGSLPGVYNVNYTYPTSAEVDYYVGKGVNVFRLPFRWERVQTSAGGELNGVEIARLDAFVNYATDKGARVILDPHNYARYYGNVIGGGTVTNADFANFWSRLGGRYAENDKVIFGLMNEPHDMPTEQWLSAANSAIAAIRATGANNLVLVPGNAWTGAHSWNSNWYGTPNGQVMTGVVDSADNFAFDVHQYLDGNSSGTSDQVVSETIGRERLTDFTNWARQNGHRAVLGEFAVSNSMVGTGTNQIGDEAINNMLDYMDANDDVWMGWTWWAGGPWWQEYRYTIEPTDLGSGNPVDRPAMNLLEPRFAGISETPWGDFNGDGLVNLADYTVWRDALGSNSDLAGNGVADGVVDAADYALWKSHFGDSAADAIGAATQVPEPREAAMLLVGAVVLLGWRRVAAR